MRFAPLAVVRRGLVPAAVLAGTALVAGPVTPALAAPPPTPTFSSAVDGYAPYEAQKTCASVPTPGILALQQLISSAYPEQGAGGTLRSCTSEAGTSEHKDGRALDWPVNAYDPAQKTKAEEVISWLLAPDDAGTPNAMFRRLGIMYVIWDGQIFGAWDHTWQPYNGPVPHTDHIHFSLGWSGARMLSSYWQQVAAPTPGVVPVGSALQVLTRDGSGAGVVRALGAAGQLTTPTTPGAAAGAPSGAAAGSSPTASLTTSLGGILASAVATATTTDGTLVAAGRGADDQVWVNRRPRGGAWTGWRPAGGIVTARPAVTADPAGGVALGGRGADGRLWVTSVRADGTVGSWSAAGGPAELVNAGPALLAGPSGRLDAVVPAADRSLWRSTRTAGRWSSWVQIGGLGKGDVGLAAGPAGPVLAVRGLDDAAWVRTLGASGTVGAGRWQPLGGRLSSSPSVVVPAGAAAADVVVVGVDGRLWRTRGSGTTWSGWTPL